jgi:hypothetical protein
MWGVSHWRKARHLRQRANIEDALKHVHNSQQQGMVTQNFDLLNKALSFAANGDHRLPPHRAVLSSRLHYGRLGQNSHNAHT